MAIEFEFYETPDPSGEGKTRYHARNVTRNNVTTEQLCKDIQFGSSLTIGDVKAVLSALNDELANHLGNGARVHLEGIGYFQATLKTTREIDPRKTRAQSVWFKSVKFRADKALKNRLLMARTIRTSIKIHSARISNDKVDKMVADYLAENRVITRKALQLLCGFTQYTANKHIKRMVEEGKIENINTRRQPVYM